MSTIIAHFINEMVSFISSSTKRVSFVDAAWK